MLHDFLRVNNKLNLEIEGKLVPNKLSISFIVSNIGQTIIVSVNIILFLLMYSECFFVFFFLRDSLLLHTFRSVQV